MPLDAHTPSPAPAQRPMTELEYARFQRDRAQVVASNFEAELVRTRIVTEALQTELTALRERVGQLRAQLHALEVGAAVAVAPTP